VHDATVWREFAQSVLSGGEIYVAYPDNKPPLWQLLNVFAEWTGEYSLVMLSLVGVGNALVVMVLFYLFYCEGKYTAAVIAAAGCLLIIVPYVPWTNNKSLATALLLLATLSGSAVRGGALLGLSVSIAQQTLLGLPAVVWYQYRRGAWSGRDTLHWCITGVMVFAAGYTLVGIVWGWASVVAAVDQTIFAVVGYGTGTSQFETTGGAFGETLVWWRRLTKRALKRKFILLLAGVGVASVVTNWKRRSLIEQFWTVYLISFAPIFLLRAYRHYWVLLAAGFGACFAVGVQSLYRGLTTE
jgi:hypothetical protein